MGQRHAPRRPSPMPPRFLGPARHADALLLCMCVWAGAGATRDLAYAGLITVIQTKTVNGMVPNMFQSVWITYDRTEPIIGSTVSQAGCLFPLPLPPSSFLCCLW
jgi:hypothetical protein